MPKTYDTTQNNSASTFLSILKGAFGAITTSLLCVLIFAFVIKFTNISENLITPINQAIKIISILVGAIITSKKIATKGWLCGLVLGGIYTLLSFLIFSILDGEFNINFSLFTDFIFGSITGLLAGIIAFALKKN